MKKSAAISIPFLAAIAAGSSACYTAHAHLNATGQCVNDSGVVIDQRACSGHGGYYGGTHYVYSNPGGASDSSPATERGVLGSSAAGHAGGEGVGE